MKTRRLVIAPVCALAALALVVGVLPCTPGHAASRPSKRTPAIEWTSDMDCTGCHAVEAALLNADTDAASAKDDGVQAEVETEAETEAKTDQPSGDGQEAARTQIDEFASQHAADFGWTCLDCHEDNDKLAAAHKNASADKQATKLKKTTVSSDLCLGCHDLESLAEQTADCTVLTDSNGTVINPHDMPEGSEHDKVTCTSCHKVHDQEETLDRNANVTCNNCHHAGVYECGTCH